MSTAADPAAGSYRSLVPARMDRLPWARFHWMVVVALGITWILDGLEVTVAGGIADVLKDKAVLGLSAKAVGGAASVYLLGEVVGALVFGRLADRMGRRKFFLVTLGVYLLGNALTAFSFNYPSFLLFRFIAGMGIGGEYAAINSAIDELIPARYRGRTDIAVNGTYWFGAIIAAGAQIFLLDPKLLPVNLGWRIAFLIGPVIGIAIWGLRRHLPESPRWLMTHGRGEEAEQTVAAIEASVRERGGQLADVPDDVAIEVRRREPVTYREIAAVMFRQYRSRSVLGLTMMITQSFLYNAIFFTYGLVLTTFYKVSAAEVPKFLIAFAVGNLLGPLTIGRLFDTIGRRVMIASTYVLSGVLLAFTGYLFSTGVLTATTQTVLWAVIFFFASAAASSAYLTVSEIFPLELRAQAIAFFFAIAQFTGGVIAPFLFGTLVGTGSRSALFVGYSIGAGLMVVGGLVAWFLAVDAERRSLEDIANPLSAVRRATTGAGERWDTSPGAAPA